MKFTNVRVLCFQADFCGVCKGVEKTRVVEKFVDEHTKAGADFIRIPVHKLSCGDAEGEQVTEEHKRNFAMSDSYEVEGFPTFIFEGKRADGSGFEIARASAETVSAFTLKEFNRVFAEGLEALEELPDDVESQDEASKRISW